LIFGAGAVDAELSGVGPVANLSLLAAFAVLTLMVAPWVAAAALRISIE
jgi:heme exporter protein B